MNLKELQDQFLNSVLTQEFSNDIKKSMIPGGKLDELGCLNAYRNDYTARLTSTLGDNFESLWTILGDEEFFSLCHDYILKNPSKLYDLGEYGNNLPEFLTDHKLPYLCELANLEIEFRRLFNGLVQAGLGPEDFAQIDDPSKIKLELSKLLFISSSQYPLYKIWEKRGDNSEHSFDKIEWSAEKFVMYNSSGTVQVKFLSLFQVNILLNLKEGKSLEEALDSSGEGNEAEVGELFSFLVSNSLILNYK